MGKIDELTNEASAMQKPVSDIAERGGSGAIAQLIQQYCPDGVEYVQLGEVCEVLTGGEAPDNAIKGKEPIGDCIYPIYSNGIGENALWGYAPTYRISKTSITFSSIGTIGFPTIRECCYTPIIRLKVIYPKDDTVLNVYFLKYVLEIVEFEKQKSSVPNINANMIKSISIPLPPLPVQEAIVNILDRFAVYAAELQAELQARQQQYQYYQDLLLNKSQYSKHITIGELCVVKKGNTPIQKAKEGKYPLVVTTMERRSCDTFQFNTNAVCIPLVSSRGHGVASLNHIYYQEGMFALGNILCAVIPNDEKVVKAKFLYYYLEYAKDYTLVPLMKGGANVSLHCSDIEKVKIPLPPLTEQDRIIYILDHFDTLVNDLSQGLPAEIEARRQQYEYYRDKLLTFKRK